MPPGPAPPARRPRETLLCALWPNGDPGLAGQSLNSLVYSLHRSLGTVLEGALPVVHEDGWYRLNTEAGVGVDAVWFDALTAAGERRAGAITALRPSTRRAVRLFRGDLCAGNDAYAVVERERLRARHLTSSLAWPTATSGTATTGPVRKGRCVSWHLIPAGRTRTGW